MSELLMQGKVGILLIPDNDRPRYLMPIDRVYTAADFRKPQSTPLARRGRTLPLLRKLDRAHDAAVRTPRKVRVIKRETEQPMITLADVARDQLIEKVRRARPLTPNAARIAINRLFAV